MRANKVKLEKQGDRRIVFTFFFLSHFAQIIIEITAIRERMQQQKNIYI